MDILIGTHNPGKLREYRLLLAEAPVSIVGLSDVGLGSVDVDETGATFRENAELKAQAYARASGIYALGDDSGLCVDALDGGPGVYSARYGGDGLDDAGRRRALLAALANVPDNRRTAYFTCVIAVADPHTGTCITVEGRCTGRIARADSDGPEGFGYDAIFVPDGFDLTFAQLSSDVKNRISHRGAAARALIPLLVDLAEEQ